MKPLLMLACIAAFQTATAQDASIRRCVGANGEPSFSDRPCTTVGAAPAPMPNAQGPTLAPITTQTCAQSATELRERVAGAFAARNAVTLSGLFLWDAHGGSATTQLRELATLVGEPVIAIDIDETASADAFEEPSREPSAGNAPILSIRSARDLEHVPREAVTRFAMLDRHRCWWLQLPE